jgi:hypothetical protein
MTQPTVPDLTLQVVSIDFGSTTSTVTMTAQYGDIEEPMDPEHVRIVRERLAALIRSDWPDERLRRDFVRTAIARFPRLDEHDKMTREGKPEEPELERLVRWLTDESPAESGRDRFARERVRTRVLEDVWDELAVFLGRQASIQDWGSHRLHDIQHQALREPALAQSNLALVPLFAESKEVNSVLVVSNHDIATGELSNASPQPGTLSYRGLKRRVLRPAKLPPELPPPADGPADSDALVGQAYRFLGDKAVEYVRRQIGGERRLSLVVATYPTTTPPAVRSRLGHLLESELGVERVEMRFDEGVAALMFVLMRDFGGDNAAGIQTFRARSRAAGTDRWRQNLLVIDIGGGTTDIALTRLELRDATPAVDRAAEATHRSGPDGVTSTGPRERGRVYYLRPDILGSTGHQQYGGDLLTLRVFYWIKAMIADAMRETLSDGAELLERWPKAADGTRKELARAVVDYDAPGPGPWDVISYLRDVLPTRSPGGNQRDQDYPPQLTPEFLLLWDTALTAKVRLAEGKSHNITGRELEDVSQLVSDAWKGQAGTINKPVKLSVHDFNRLATSVLSPAIALAVDLARRRLAAEPGELLDGIALTGRAAGIPLVRQLVLEQVAKAFDDRGEEHHDGRAPIAWNPALVTAEQGHPKAAASIGACWAQAQRENATHKSPRQLADSPPYLSGRDQLIIDVDNIVTHLPCRFGLGTSERRPIELFGHGRRLEYADSKGRRFTRTRWFPAQPDIRLLRYLDQDEYILWGRFNIPSRHGPIPAGLHYQIEIDDELETLLHMCMGAEPRLVLYGSSVSVKELGGLSTSMPWNICVRHADETTGEQSWQTVIEAIPTITGATFRHEFVIHGTSSVSGTESPVRGVTSIELPPPEEGSLGPLGYTFAGIIPDFRTRPDGTVPGDAKVEWSATVQAPQRAAGGPDVQYWAVLTESGGLWVVPGYPRYEPQLWQAMLDRPGSVFTTPMELHESELRPEWDPFTGEH